jgi:hypothetical protein
MESFLGPVKNFYEKHEGRISSAALIFGFVFDSFTLKRIDLLFENLVIVFYLTLSGVGIALFNYLNSRELQKPFLIEVRRIFPIFIQFAFGGLFSAFFIFYSRSATLSSSWPFILILLTLLIGNEFYRKEYQKITFQVSIYFMAIFSFFIFFVPIILKNIGYSSFIISGVLSLLVISLFTIILSKIVPEQFSQNRRGLITSISSLFILINILYFTNIIPPIPLSLKSAAPYYFVERVAGGYNVEAPIKKWYEIFERKSLYLNEGESAYVFSSIFAPTNLNIDIIHDWQYYDETKGRWVSSRKISFLISGGRDAGYRGFSVKNNVFPGKWRVDIKTERNQIIGRVKFNIKDGSETSPKISTKTL